MRQHGWFRPHVRGLTAISSTTLREGGGDIITSIFADGTDGFYFDFSKTDRLFQSPSGSGTGGQIPADDAGENIGLAHEAHNWAGATLASVIASASELVSNGTFATDISGWTDASVGTGAIAYDATGGGSMVLTRPDGANIGIARQSFATVVGRTYRVSIDASGNDAQIRAGTSAGSTVNLSSAVSGAGKVLNFVATATTTHIQLNAAANGATTYVDNVSIKEIPGNHGLQATTAAQPKWQTGGLARFDGSDDHLLIQGALRAGSAMTLLFKCTPSAGSGFLTGVRASGTDDRLYLGFDAGGQLVGYVGPATPITRSGSLIGATGVAGLVISGSDAALYWDGAEVASSGSAMTPNATQPFALGGAVIGGTPQSFFNGDMNDALAIKKALTAAEIAAITNLWGTS